MRRAFAVCICAVMLFSLAFSPGCASGTSSDIPFEPVFHENNFSADPTLLDGGVELDISTASDGYIGVRLPGENKCKALVNCGDLSFSYPLNSDGTVNYLPLQCGSGTYYLQILQNTVATRYIEIATAEFSAEVADPLSPFVRSNVYVSYTRDSDAVKMADEMAAAADSELDFFESVYTYIKKNIDYDYELAATVKSGYLPDPDRTLSSQKGICLDYASLAAAMLRSQGIPTKLITGYAGEQEIYHAWNEVYLQQVGWVTVELSVKERGWNRIDITFAANDCGQTYYVDRYVF